MGNRGRELKSSRDPSAALPDAPQDGAKKKRRVTSFGMTRLRFEESFEWQAETWIGGTPPFVTQGGPHSELAAGDGGQMALRANGAGGGGDFLVAGFQGLREREQRRGVDGGDDATLGESDGNFRRSDMLRKFGHDEEIEAASREKRGVDGAFELLDGSANHRETVLGSVGDMAPSLIGETNLEAIAGH